MRGERRWPVLTRNPNTKAFDEKRYDWVANCAPKLWESRLAVFYKMDDRAGSLLAWISGATGLLAGGVTLALADDKLHWIVATAFLPSFICVLVAVVELLRTRLSSELYPPPRIHDCVKFVEGCYPKGQIAILSNWHKAITRITTVSQDKAVRISGAIWHAAWAVTLLLVPLVIAIIGKANGLLSKISP